MQEYHVAFAGEAPHHTLEAGSLAEALSELATQPHEAKPAELWCEGRLLSRLELIEGNEGSFWRVS